MMAEMVRSTCVAAVLALMVHLASFQTIFQPEDLKWSSFSGCCGAQNACQEVGSPNYYRYLSVSNDTQSLWVGAMNFLFKLKIQDMSCEKHAYLNVDEKKTMRCKVQGKSKTPDCQNHIRTIIELNENKVFVCGTGSYSPVNYTLDRRSLSKKDEKAGTALCPYDPMDNNTAIKIDSGNPWDGPALYFGTYSDFIKNFPVFYRPDEYRDGKHYLRKTSDREDKDWLNSPQFVGSFDEDDSVLFFFRESGVESPNDDRKIYSRVGKVCKKDQGGGQLEITRTKWLSFQKARLNCSLPGNQPYYYDDIYDVYKKGDYYYALFYKQAGALSSSAICLFKKSEILNVFRGKFQHRNANGNWETLATDPSPRLDNCTLYENNNYAYNEVRSRHQLMDSTVKPVFGEPIYYMQGVQMMKIAVSETINNSRNIYVASDQGKVYDIFFKEGSSNDLSGSIVKLIKVYEPFPLSERSDAVWSMKLVDNAVLLGTDYNVTRLELDVCSSIYHIDVCIQDTICVWNKCIKKCTSYTGTGVTQDCSISHNDLRHDVPILKLLMQKNVIPTEAERKEHKGIVGIYTTLEILYPVSRKLSRWRRAIQDQPETDILMDDRVAKFALSAKGDLMIANTTFEDHGHYRAYDQDNTLIADYYLNVIKDDEEIVEAWKQQFTDWSMAFLKWKTCSHDYFQGCVNAP